MNPGRMLSTAIFLALCAISSPSDATPINGVFSGTASGIIDAEDPVNGRDFFNEPTSGTFTFETELVGDVYEEPWGIVVLNQPVTLTFDLFGRHLEFDSLFSSWPTMTLDRRGQVLGLGADQGPYYSANLWLVGRPGGLLFRDVDLSTFDPAQVDISRSFASFFAGRSFVGGVQLDTVSIEGVQVPEPSSFALFLASMAVFAALWRRPFGAFKSRR